MKNVKKPLLIASGIMIAIGLSAAAVAGPGHKGMGHAPGMRLLRLAESLELTETQEVALVRMRRKIRKQAKANRKEMHGSFDEVLLELEKPQPDQAKLHRLVDEGAERMKKLMHTSIDDYVKFHQTLSEEQRQQLVDNARLMKERRHNRKGRRFKKQ